MCLIKKQAKQTIYHWILTVSRWSFLFIKIINDTKLTAQPLDLKLSLSIGEANLQIITIQICFRKDEVLLRDHLFSIYAKFSKKPNFSYPLIFACTNEYQEIRSNSFSDNFA